MDRPKNRRLTEEERTKAQGILAQVRKMIHEAASEDKALAWALRRYVYIRLQHDERGNPMQRKILKLKKMVEQENKCARCGVKLPQRGAELDRYNAMEGYTIANTRLLCHDCHTKGQSDRGFA